MLRRSVKVQIVVFAVLAALGVSYVSLSYIGLGERIFGGTYTVSADFADSGGIFTNAEVTYRGVQVGRVGQLHLRRDGVRVDMLIRAGAPRIPESARAVVTDRSAVGEQFVDLQPRTDGAPFLRAGSVIPLAGTRIPVSTQALLLNLDLLVRSVNRIDLTTVVDQLGTAFAGTGPDLQSLLDYGDALLASARAALPQTVRLIDDAATVLDTQRVEGSAIQSFARSLALLTAQLRTSDPDLRAVLANAPPAVSQVVSLINENRTDLGILLSNLVTTGQLTMRRTQLLREVLILYPLVVASGYTVAPDGTAHVGLVLNLDDPPPCVRGYGGTDRRPPADTRGVPANTRAYCADPSSSGTDVRGAQNAPRYGPVTPYPGSGFPADGTGRPGSSGPAGGPARSGDQGAGASPRAAAGEQVPEVGSTGGDSQVLGDRSWLGPLLAGIGG
jgi:phospholipid/cholesterol/gamma-HCH transport system substrate-binding protein